MGNLLKGFLALGFVFGGLFLSGCKVNGRVVIGAPRHDYPPYRRWCGYDRWGYRTCDNYRGGWGPWSSEGTVQTAGADVQGNNNEYTTGDQRIAQVSERYNVSHYAAAYVVNAVVRAEQGDLSGLTTVGLSQQDAETIYNGGTLPASTINNVGEKVRMTNKDTTRLLNQIAQVVRNAQ